jgi:hypothetical protein
MRAPIIDTLLLLALPASGKSEVRRYLESLPAERCRDELGLGPTVQLDDFPYVHLMRRISDELTAREHPGTFFLSPALPFREPRDWGTLIELLNEDHADVVAAHRPAPESAAEWLCDRLDAARKRVGAPAELSTLAPPLRSAVTAAIEAECRDLLDAKVGNVPDSLAGRTVVLEFARGGADGSPLPLPPPYGYRYSLACLSHEILDRAAILYIWVTPQESRRKNAERADPDDPGSILHHGVPRAVMYGDYGCDDIEWLIDSSDRPGTVPVEKEGRTYHLPVARFDNRTDLTSFLRADPEAWSEADVAALHAELSRALAALRPAADA